MHGKIPSWKALRGRELRKNNERPPLHVKDVVASLDLDACLRLKQRNDTRNELLRAMRWVRPSPAYDELRRILAEHCFEREHRTSLDADDIKLIFDLRKMEVARTSPVAWCNAFAVEEEKEDGPRRRPIFEPLINDILKMSNDELLDVSTVYTSKDELRRAVFASPCAAQFDFAAWFDQIPLDPAIRDLFGVVTPNGSMQLTVTPMGYRPSCQIAQAASNSISDVPTRVFHGGCVDNIIFMGSGAEVTDASKHFLRRSAAVGAQVKDATIALATAYDFLGEHYDHSAKTRRLTEKTSSKAAYAGSVLRTGDSFTTKQLLAIFGLLLYAAGTLRITIARFHWAMRFLSFVAATEQGETHIPDDGVRAEMILWCDIAAKNEPVPVWTEDVEPDITIYTDASATGWGAISISKGGTILQLSQPWTEDDWRWNLFSSVAAEPLAMRKAIAAMVPCTAKKVVIYTDHLPLHYAMKKTFGRAYSYSLVAQLVGSYRDCVFDVRFIPGTQNPADVLSRAQHPPVKQQPPLLNVTAIGTTKVNMFGERRGMGIMG